jgi:hypothetical protein
LIRIKTKPTNTDRLQKKIVMEEFENKKQLNEEVDLLESRLRGDLSVRVTFRLSRELIDVLGFIAGQFGVKRKSLFDQLVEDGVMLDEVADSIASMNGEDGVQRRSITFVVSSRFLQTLQQAANSRRISRHILTEALIHRWLPLHFSTAKRSGKGGNGVRR